MTKIIGITKKIAAWIGKRLKSNYAAEWTVIGLGSWLIYTQAKTLGIAVAILGIVYLVNSINRKETAE